MNKDKTITTNQPTSLRTAKELLDTISQQLQSFDSVTMLSQSKVIKGDSNTTNQLALLQTTKE